MAVQLNTTYTSRVEDLIYYKRLGDYLIRTVGQQSTATKRAATDFGRASSLSKDLRQVLNPIIPDRRDRKMQNSLRVSMLQFLASTQKERMTDLQNNPLSGFRFAADSSLSRCLLFPLNIDEVEGEKIRISIPEINPAENILVPPGTSKVEIVLMTATVHPEHDLAFSSETTVLEIPYLNGAQTSRTAELRTETVPGAMTVLVAAVKYRNGSEEIRQPGFMPVEIVAARQNN